MARALGRVWAIDGGHDQIHDPLLLEAGSKEKGDEEVKEVLEKLKKEQERLERTIEEFREWLRQQKEGDGDWRQKNEKS